ncbi:MAG TPA: dihydrolipoyllysine-residue acetyltransferase [Burkholderiales bacterium]|nr:dihydrolipoyllysine-residue acetyltransferase [Burkholderiales bacterium]
MGAVKDVLVPDIGDFKNVPVIEVLVKPGDAVSKEDPLLTLESDKATMDIPSPYSGVVKALKVKVGDKVSEGSVVLAIEANEEAAVAAAAPAKVVETVAALPTYRSLEMSEGEVVPSSLMQESKGGGKQLPPPTLPQMPERMHLPHASPSVRRFARELGVNLDPVSGSGPKSRILKEDVQAYVKGELSRPRGGAGFALPEMPQVDFAKYGPVESKPLSRIKKLSGANLHRNWVSIPHVTQHDEADITDLEAFRKSNSAETEKQGFKLTMLSFLIKACVTALKAHPEFNASLDKSGENLVLKKYYHIGVAVDTPDGLVVPVIRDADRKGVFDLARQLAEISKRARDKKLSPAEMQGGCFSISSLGGLGGTAFTPIINAPEVAILGVSKAQLKPVYQNGQLVPRLLLPLSLSYDHRVIDGAAAARFTTYLCSVLSDIRRLLL